MNIGTLYMSRNNAHGHIIVDSVVLMCAEEVILIMKTLKSSRVYNSKVGVVITTELS